MTIEAETSGPRQQSKGIHGSPSVDRVVSPWATWNPRLLNLIQHAWSTDPYARPTMAGKCNDTACFTLMLNANVNTPA